MLEVRGRCSICCEKRARVQVPSRRPRRVRLIRLDHRTRSSRPQPYSNGRYTAASNDKRLGARLQLRRCARAASIPAPLVIARVPSSVARSLSAASLTDSLSGSHRRTRSQAPQRDTPALAPRRGRRPAKVSPRLAKGGDRASRPLCRFSARSMLTGNSSLAAILIVSHLSSRASPAARGRSLTSLDRTSFSTRSLPPPSVSWPTFVSLWNCLEADHFLPPRSVSVVPGHAPKVFVPYQNILTGPSTPSTSSSPPASPPAHATRHVFVSAAVTSLQDGYVELDRDLLEHERDLDGDEQEVDRLTAELEQAQLEADGQREKRQAPRRLKWDYLIYVSSHRGYEPLLLERVLTRSSAGAWLHPAASTRIRGTNEGGRSYFPRGASFGNERLRADRLSSRASPRRPSGKRSTAPTRS